MTHTIEDQSALLFPLPEPGVEGETLVAQAMRIFAGLDAMPRDQKIATLNALRRALAQFSPFASEPVDCIQWVPVSHVRANDYNPNSVAPPEMQLLEHSIAADGYTQPIVAWRQADDIHEVVDGFHRNRVGRESAAVRKRIEGYLPLAVVNTDREDRGDRIAATIRHNRARGRHQVERMSDIVVELKRRNWTEDRICRELGMDKDEVLRLCQITGLAELFADQEFSASWDVQGHVTEDDFQELTDDVETYDATISRVRTVNTSDPGRIFHTYELWECHKAGFYATTKDGMTRAECETAYRDFLGDLPRFEGALQHVISEWRHSCEHYLTNVSMNRIAWLGQAAACYAMGIPACFRGGFSLLTPSRQEAANETALTYLNKWNAQHDRPEVSMADALADGRQVEIY